MAGENIFKFHNNFPDNNDQHSDKLSPSYQPRRQLTKGALIRSTVYYWESARILKQLPTQMQYNGFISMHVL